MEINIPFMEESPSGFNVFKYLDVSMGHITASDCRLLESDAVCSMPNNSFGDKNVSRGPCAAIVYKKEDYGFFVHVCSDFASEYEKNFRKAGYSNVFLMIFHEALAVGASWICFDVDGSVSKRLPVFAR